MSGCAQTLYVFEGEPRLPFVILEGAMRVCVFVDGENLRHSICDLYKPHFDQKDYLPKQADWGMLFDELVSDATDGQGERLRTYWYVVQHVDTYPPLPKNFSISNEKLDTWAERNSKQINSKVGSSTGNERYEKIKEIIEDLRSNRDHIKRRFDGFHTIQNGITQKHRAIEFRRSGSIGYNLHSGRLGQEKTVDVNLAVDMVRLHDMYDLALVVSGDQDYVPAAQAVKNLGRHVVNVAFNARNGKLLPGGAKRLNQVTDWSLAVEWERLRQILRIEVQSK